MTHHPFPRLQSMQQFLRPVRSLELARQIQAQPHQCFLNAWRTMILYPEQFNTARFVEGWLVLEQEEDVGLTEHGWIVLPDHGIIDPSILLITSFTQPVFYVEGLRRTWQETEALEDQMLPQVRFDGLHGEDGLLHAGYKAARDVALAHVYARSFAHHPPKPMRFWLAQDLDTASSIQMAQVDLGLGDASLDLDRSRALASQVDARPGHFWDTARHALRQHRDLFWHPAYVEGWLVRASLDALWLIEAAWIKDRGRVLDLTSALDDWHTTNWIEYFAGSRWSWQEARQLAGHLLPAARFLDTTHPGSLAYSTAYQQALARAEQLAWKTGLPLTVRPAVKTAHAFWPLPPATSSEPQTGENR